MSGHSRWSMIKNHQELSDALGETPGDEIRVKGMIHFCQGYLLALEDVLSDIDDLDPPNYRYWELIRKVKDSIRQAQATLNQLQKKVNDAE